MTQIRDCPKCHAADALETFLRIDLDDVVVDSETEEVVSFILAGSANDPHNGLVTESAQVTCRECGHALDASVPVNFTSRWLYYPTNTRADQAQKLCHLLNRRQEPRDALASLGIEPEDVSVEEGLSLDDPDNDIIDLGADEHGFCPYVERHNGRWHVHHVTRDD